MMNDKGVSLIICTYNGAGRLPATIAHVNDQKVSGNTPWELIVVDNASEDGSDQVAKNSWRGMAPFRVICEPKKGLIHARHRGIQEARFEYISFIDDDNWIDPHWIQNVFMIFETHPEVGMCGGMSTGTFETTPPHWFSRFEGSYAIGRQGTQTGDITTSQGQLWGAGLSFRKSAFEELMGAGFNSILTGRKGNQLLAGEDTELAFAFKLAGWKLWYSEDLKLQHYITRNRMDWNYTRKMYKGFGYSHAIFEIYKAVLYQRRLWLPLYLPVILYQFMPFIFWKLVHWKRYYEGNKMDLLYQFHKSKLIKAIAILPQAISIHRRILNIRIK